MNYKLWLDDERYPTDGTVWFIARNFSDATWYVIHYGLPEFISFDHDLGSSKITGMDFCKWLCNFIMDNDLPYNGLEYRVHSANPVGAANIDAYMAQFLKDYWK
jgi:hypothetical protein